MLKKIGFSFSLLLLLAGCGKDPECNYNECSVKAPQTEIDEVKAYLQANNISNATQHCSGVFYVIDAAGSGSNPNFCSEVNATYTGRFKNGSQFDAGTASFGLREVITGWTNTIPLLKKGGKIRLFIPPTLAYGPNDYRSIPGGSMLIFEVTLNDFN